MFGKRFFIVFFVQPDIINCCHHCGEVFCFMKIHCNMNERGSDFSHNAQLRARAVYISYAFDKKNESWMALNLRNCDEGDQNTLCLSEWFEIWREVPVDVSHGKSVMCDVVECRARITKYHQMTNKTRNGLNDEQSSNYFLLKRLRQLKAFWIAFVEDSKFIWYLYAWRKLVETVKKAFRNEEISKFLSEKAFDWKKLWTIIYPKLLILKSFKLKKLSMRQSFWVKDLQEHFQIKKGFW